MPPHRTAPAFAIAFALALSLSAVGLFLGCSGSPVTPAEGGTSGAIGNSGASSGGQTSGSSGTSGTSGADGGTSGTTGTLATCISACEARFPKGAQLGKGIDACWMRSCNECDGIAVGQPKPPKNGTCKNPVSTPNANCSQCTVDECCTAWDACFDNTDCAALNTCSIACYK